MGLRKGLNLDLTTLSDGFFMCPHGNYNTMKTYLSGSMLRWALRNGGTAVFLNLSGEDGYRTLANFPEIEPWRHIWDADDWKGIEEAQEVLEKEPVTALAVDGGKKFAEMVALKVTKNINRPLQVSNERGVSNTDWPDMHYYLPQMIQRLRRCARFVILTAPSDIGADPLDIEGAWYNKKSRQIRPDFPGKSAGFSRGWFDFLGYCEVEIDTDVGRTDITRKIHFEYSDKFSTRARVVTPLTRPIIVPEGPDCWETIYNALEAHCKPPGKEGKPEKNQKHKFHPPERVKSTTQNNMI